MARGAQDLRKSAGDRQSPEGPRRDDRHGLMGGVVDDGQALHDPPIRRAIKDEVRGPDLMATLGAHQWLAVGSRDLLASTALQLEPGLRVQAVDPFCAGGTGPSPGGLPRPPVGTR